MNHSCASIRTINITKMFFYIAIAIVCLIYYFFKKKFAYWDERGFPYVEPSIPLGNMGTIGFKEHMSVFLKREYDNFKDKGPAFGMYFLSNPILVVTDPELIKEVNVKSFESFHERGLYVNEKADPLWKNLFTAGGQEWKDLRAKLSPTFTSGRIKMMFSIVSQAADRMVAYLKQEVKTKEYMEMKELFASYGTEVIANVAFGLDIECLGHPDNSFRLMANHVFKPGKWQNFRNFLIFSMPSVAKFFNMGINPQHVIDFYIGIVRDNLEYREKNNIQRNDFFQLLINIKNSDIGMSMNEIAANSFIFFAAGFETSSSVMTFCSYELALNQDIQDRVRNEIEEVVGHHNGEVTYDAITEMKYLDMVFNETLRRYPVVDVHVRKSTKEFKIPKTELVIPAGTAILIPAVGLHNDKKYFENPDKFDPERFNPKNVKKIVPNTYIPFSDGPRMCIGMRFGTMQSKVGLIQLLRNYKIYPCKKTLIPMKYEPTAGFQSPMGGMWLRLEKVNDY